MKAKIDASVRAAIAEKLFPGAVVLAARAGTMLHHAAYGTTMYADPGSQLVAPDTIYDIASLTKLFTATAALMLIDGGAIDLDTPAANILPAIQARAVTLRHLLSHSSGLDLRLAPLRSGGSAAIRAAAYAALPTHLPGNFAAYSNINSLLLGDVVAAVYGAPLDQVFCELLLEPLGMAATGFTPPAALHVRIAPTEWDREWRGELVHGKVHDESAYALGGVAGHAGLFSSAGDLERFGRMWLQGGVWQGRQLLREATVATAWRDQTAAMGSPTGRAVRSGLGWMLDRPNFMGNAPPGSPGHTGFTGPAIVLVPAHGLALIVLSNRTYPQRTPPPYKHHAVSAALVQAVLGL